MHIDQEDIDAMKSQHAEDRQDFIDAKAKVDNEIPDHLIKPFKHAHINGKTESASFVSDSHSDELFKLAKLIERMAEAKQAMEATEADLKKAGITL
jgi:hypothetical protein